MRSGILEYDAIVTVARLGGFRAAAAELNMSPSALSNAVAALETKLKVRLSRLPADRPRDADAAA